MMIFSNRNLTIIERNKKTAFTMVELVIVSIMIATWLIWIVVSINAGIGFAERTKTNIIAVNMAREWIEWVYNIRDTNRQRWWIKKEQCWLKIDPLTDEWPANSGCWDDGWVGNDKNYVLLSKDTSPNKYLYLRYMGNTPLNINNRIDINDNLFAMCQNAWQWYNCNGVGSPDTKEWRFFRAIRWIWLYSKEDWNSLNCNNWGGPDIECRDSSAKEYRFCSTVQYMAGWIWQVELCWVITNFLK